MGQEKISKETIDNLDIEKRRSTAAEWVVAAQDVAEKTGSQEAQELVTFIDEQAGIGVPKEGLYIGQFFIGKPPELPEEKYVFLTPIIDEDRNRLPTDDYRLSFLEGNGGSIAHYNEGNHALYLPGIELSTAGKGVLLLHEAAHAWLDIEGQIDRNYPEGHWLEEADIYEFEFELLRALGSKAYENAVQKLLANMRPLEDDPTMLSTHNDLTPEEKLDFARTLGITEEAEEELWFSICAFNAFHEYYKRHKSDSRHAFAMFLKQKSNQ